MQIGIKAYGKINIFLDLLGKRTDGYHEVKMIMQSVRLYDEVVLAEASKNQVMCDSLYVPNNENNLAMRAALLLQERFDVPPVAIKIKKHIPVSAGMAGGSTDAAAVLVGANELFKLGLDEATLLALGAELGSDVPFCIRGGTALCTGRGEIVEPLVDIPKMHVVLARADYGVSTASVYKAIEPEDIQPRDGLCEAVLKAIEAGDSTFIATHLYNALEIPSFRTCVCTRTRKEKLLASGAKNILMSGSGPTLFGLYASECEAWENYKKIKGLCRHVYLTSTCHSDLINSRLTFME